MCLLSLSRNGFAWEWLARSADFALRAKKDKRGYCERDA